MNKTNKNNKTLKEKNLNRYFSAARHTSLGLPALQVDGLPEYSAHRHRMPAHGDQARSAGHQSAKPALDGSTYPFSPRPNKCQTKSVYIFLRYAPASPRTDKGCSLHKGRSVVFLDHLSGIYSCLYISLHIGFQRNRTAGINFSVLIDDQTHILLRSCSALLPRT